VVGVGTMNYMHTPEQIVGGILEIVKTCHEKQPQAELLVMVDRACHSYSLSFQYYNRQELRAEQLCTHSVQSSGR